MMMKRLIYTLLVMMVVRPSVLRAQDVRITNQSPAVELELPPSLENAVRKIQHDLLGNEKGRSRIKVIDKNCLHIRFSFSPGQTLPQDDWQVVVTPGFTPSFHWAPHLTPTDRHVVEQHVFRSPALIAADGQRVITLIPDLDILLQGTPVRWYLDMDAPGNRLVLGMSSSAIDDHVLFMKEAGATYPAEEVEIGFYLMVHDDEGAVKNPFRAPLEFLWSRWGHDLYEAGNPVDGELEKYVEHTYNWAFNTWSENVWQEFSLNGKKVGAPIFIVNVTQSPNYPGEVNEREFRSIWNQAWFSSLRSASGLFRYARRTGNGVDGEGAAHQGVGPVVPPKEWFFPGIDRHRNARSGDQWHEVQPE